MPHYKPHEHHIIVAQLSKSGIDILSSLSPAKCEAWHHASCIQGEAGELFDAVKKWVIYNGEVNRTNIIEELGDIEFYLEGLRQCFGISREETLQANLDKLVNGTDNKPPRYTGAIYSDESAQTRADKDQVLPSPDEEICSSISPEGTNTSGPETSTDSW